MEEGAAGALVTGVAHSLDPQRAHLAVAEEPTQRRLTPDRPEDCRRVMGLGRVGGLAAPRWGVPVDDVHVLGRARACARACTCASACTCTCAHAVHTCCVDELAGPRRHTCPWHVYVPDVHAHVHVQVRAHVHVHRHIHGRAASAREEQAAEGSSQAKSSAGVHAATPAGARKEQAAERVCAPIVKAPGKGACEAVAAEQHGKLVVSRLAVTHCNEVR